MNAEQENEFTALRRLLKLKRYEQPPPRYFNDFSGQIIERIKFGGKEAREDAGERMAWESPWLNRVLNTLLGKPIVAGAFGAAVCLLVVAGLVSSENSPPAPPVVQVLRGADN